MFHFEDPQINSETINLLHELFETFNGSDEEKNIKTQSVLKKIIEQDESIFTNHLTVRKKHMKLHIEYKENHFEFNNFDEFEEIIDNNDFLTKKDYKIVYHPEDDNETIDKAIFDGFKIDVDDLEEFYSCIEKWDYDEKILALINLESYGDTLSIYDIDFVYLKDRITYYEVDTLFGVAEQLYKKGSYEQVPEWLENHMEKVYQAIEEEIEPDWNEVKIDGRTFWFNAY